VLRLNARESQKRGQLWQDRVGLDTRLDGWKYPWQLSGGMNQRLLTAVALAEPADLVVADEPTKGLDSEHKKLAVNLLLELCNAGKTLLVITHDPEVAERLGGDLAVMYAGRLMETGPTEALLRTPRHPYTRALWAARPQNGLIPIPINGNGSCGGCVFSPRCTEAQEQCFNILPPKKSHERERRIHFCHLNN
jgi:peptide/nickel transport system ATP-binding protein